VKMKFNPSIGSLFDSAANLISHKKQWRDQGLICDPCDPKLPLQYPEAFYGDKEEYIHLIVSIVDFIRDTSNDLLFLKGPKGIGKTTFAKIFNDYCQQLDLTSHYQDAAVMLSEDPLHHSDSSLTLVKDNVDVIIVDNAYHLHHTLRKLQSLKHTTSDSRPKIVAIMNSTEYEIYRRESIHFGDTDYLHYCSMPVFQISDITSLLKKRLTVCSSEPDLSNSIFARIPMIASLSHGNPGFSLRLLGEMLHFSSNLDETMITFGISRSYLQEFSPSKSPILREILIRELENDYRPSENRDYIIHKELTQLMNKTKSTISHHLSDLLAMNLIYEQSTLKDRREKAYRPNKTIIGLLEHLAFEISHKETTSITNEGINHAK
jgi:DNA-binding transcriptional ArsR family regulator